MHILPLSCNGGAWGMWVSLTFLSLNQIRSSLTLLCNHVLLISVLLVHSLTLTYFVFSVVDEVTGLDSKNFASRFWLRFRVSRSQERWAGEVSCRTRPSKVNFLFIVTHACRFRRIDSPGNDSFDWPYYWKKKPNIYFQYHSFQFGFTICSLKILQYLEIPQIYVDYLTLRLSL